MTLSLKTLEYKIPEYSCTGDLLAHMNCGLQYRYHNKGSLPPAKPVQLWFGEFVHGVIEEAYLHWNTNHIPFPWDWRENIRPIELLISNRLSIRGLTPTPNVFCPYDESFNREGLCRDGAHPHKFSASKRCEKAINIWGQHLFPLIEESEVKLKGIRPMPNYIRNVSRSNYYGITGIIDVISSVNIEHANTDNLILNYIQRNEELQRIISESGSTEFEIIVDYKGTRRPAKSDPMWRAHQLQIITYSWLRRQQPQNRRVLAGIIFYLNELEPSDRDLIMLHKEIEARPQDTDIIPSQDDLNQLFRWSRGTRPMPDLSDQLKIDRSIRLIPITEATISESLATFDGEVNRIENCVLREMQGQSITEIWNANQRETTCTACDFKTFCPATRSTSYNRITVP